MTENKRKQLKELQERVKTYLAPSKIHGIGVFAMRDLKKGEKLYADQIPVLYSITPADMKDLGEDICNEIIGKWPQIYNDSYFAYPTTKIQAYMNHSEKPAYNAFSDSLIRAVKKGEEITEDYTAIPNYEKAHPWLVVK